LKEETEKGLNALKNRDFEKAKQVFGAVIDKKPESAKSHLGLSFSLLNLGDFPEAEKHMKAAHSLFEAQFSLYEAYVSAKELLKIKGSNLNYIDNLLRIYVKLNFFKSFADLLLEVTDTDKVSDEELEELLSKIAPLINEENIKPLFIFKKKHKPKEEEKLNPFENLELANLLFEIGSTDEAKNEYYKTARAFLDKELKDKALELFVKIKELYPDDEELENLKTEIDTFGEQDEATDIGERMKKLKELLPTLENENEPRVRYSFAVLFKEFSRFEEAEHELDAIFTLPKSPEKIKAYVLLSQIYLDWKDEKRAVKVLNNVIDSEQFTEEEIVPLEYKLGSIYERIQDYDKARDIYEIALAKNPEYLDLVEKVKQLKELIEKKARKPEKETSEEVRLELEPSKVPEEKALPKEEETLEEQSIKERILYI